MINSSTDIQSLAYSFVQAERATQDQYFSSRKTAYQDQLKAYNSIADKVEALQSTLTSLSRNTQFESYRVTQSAEGYAKITTGTNTPTGQYQITIDRMATAHQLALSFSSEDELMPTSGTLTLGVGSESFVLDMSELKEDATLADLRDAINNASDNPGIRATLVRSGGSVQLLISSQNTGEANTLSLSTSGAEMSDIQDAIDNATEVSAAQDAQIKLGGTLTLTSATNKFENVIDGLTIDITKTHQPGEILTFTVAKDTEATKTQLQKLVDGYNAIVTTISGLKDSKALSGDSTSRMLLNQMRAELNQYDLYGLGLEFDRSGKLSINSERLNSYLEENPEGLSQVLSGDNGLLKSLNKRLDKFVKGDSAMLNSAKNTVQSNLDRIQDRMERFDAQMEQVYYRYVNQFSQMQTLIMQMEQTFNLF